MTVVLTTSPLLWYLNRSTGLVVLALLTLSTLLGLTATGGAGRWVPRFTGQAFHRNVALWSTTLLVAHVVTAVIDSYVDIRWWQAFVPWWHATYLPLWLGLGTVAFDVVLVLVATSLVRSRMRLRTWKRVHLLSYVAWGVAVAHGLGIGTDLRAGGWERGAVWASVILVGAAVALRVVRVPRARRLEESA